MPTPTEFQERVLHLTGTARREPGSVAEMVARVSRIAGASGALLLAASARYSAELPREAAAAADADKGLRTKLAALLVEVSLMASTLGAPLPELFGEALDVLIQAGGRDAALPQAFGAPEALPELLVPPFLLRPEALKTAAAPRVLLATLADAAVRACEGKVGANGAIVDFDLTSVLGAPQMIEEPAILVERAGIGEIARFDPAITQQGALVGMLLNHEPDASLAEVLSHLWNPAVGGVLLTRDAAGPVRVRPLPATMPGQPVVVVVIPRKALLLTLTRR